MLSHAHRHAGVAYGVSTDAPPPARRLHPRQRMHPIAMLVGVVALCLPGLAGAQSLTVTPSSVALPVGSNRQMSALLDGTATNAVDWSVNGIPGGNTTLGTVDASGRYVAPAQPPTGWNVTLAATLKANPSLRAESTVTVRHPIPWPTTVSPTQVALGPFTLRVTGTRFVSGAQVLWNGTPLPTTFDSATQLTATGVASKAGPVEVTVANPGPGALSKVLPYYVTTSVLVAVTPTFAKLAVGSSQSFQAAVTGNANTAVIWTVNGHPGGDPGLGMISPAGVYTAPTIVPPSGLVTVAAVSVADGVSQATAALSIFDPQAITHGRFLDQTTFGVTPQALAHLAEVGIDAYLDEQFAMPESPLPSTATATRADVVDAFFGNAFRGQDQLRQRVILALSEIIVVALNKNTNANEILPWLQLLSRHAFGNYRTLLAELTTNPSMGKYLDHVNSGAMGGAANENYPREVMQLFSIGLVQLNPDGSPQLDANGRTIPTYDQTDVRELSKALSGWTYGNASGVPPLNPRYSYDPNPLLPLNSRHTQTSKTFLGQTLPANQGILQDLEDTIDILFEHPNVGPFLATRLIRALVTSNPSPAYIARVSAAFADDGNGVRGDMQAMLRAILLDPEARDDAPPSHFGRLRTPMQHTLALCRALGLDPGKASSFAYLFYGMSEGLLDPASVFGHYSPSNRIPKTNLFGPEFQIFSMSDAINRANFFYHLMYQPWPIDPVLQPFVVAAADPVRLVDAVDQALLFGRMSATTRQSILDALPAMPDNNARALSALYLTALSGEHLVQR